MNIFYVLLMIVRALYQKDTMEKMQKITDSGKEIILFFEKPIYQENIQAENREEMFGENSNHTDAVTEAFIDLVKAENSRQEILFPWGSGGLQSSVK